MPFLTHLPLNGLLPPPWKQLLDKPMRCQNSSGSLERWFLILSVCSIVGGPRTCTFTPGSNFSNSVAPPKHRYSCFLPMVMRFFTASKFARLSSPIKASSLRRRERGLRLRWGISCSIAPEKLCMAASAPTKVRFPPNVSAAL